MNKEYFITSICVHKILFSVLKEPKIPYRLSLDLRITFSHVSKIIKLLKEEGFIEEEIKDKRSKLIKLTDKGRIFTNQLKKVYDLLKK
jgi:DNA-binding MarR family transcriptional regulator